MRKRYHRKVVGSLLLIMCTGIFLMGFGPPVSDVTGLLVWRDESMNINPDAFYVADVLDLRTDKKTIGLLIPVVKDVTRSTGVPASIHGGGLSAIEKYIKHSLPYNSSYRPVIINIKKLWINESVLPDGRVDGKIELSFSFDLKTGDDMSVHLTNYTSGVHYIRASNQTDMAEPFLRRGVESALVYFNDWIKHQEDTNPVLAKEVKLVFNDYQEQPENDTIYYSAKRPLIWDDFKAKPRQSIFAAEVIPGIGYTEQTSINKGVIDVNIAMKVYLPKSASWVKPGNLNEYNLNHEQRHFDIVKIASERFKKHMLAEKLPVLNYDGTINVEYFETMREMDKLQKQYDAETGHGTNQSEQQRWDRYIDQELAKANS